MSKERDLENKEDARILDRMRSAKLSHTRTEPFKLVVDGQEVREVRRVQYDSSYPGEVPVLTVEQNFFGGEMEIDARITVNLVPMQECVIEELPEKDGKKRWVVLGEGHTLESLVEVLKSREFTRQLYKESSDA